MCTKLAGASDRIGVVDMQYSLQCQDDVLINVFYIFPLDSNIQYLMFTTRRLVRGILEWAFLEKFLSVTHFAIFSFDWDLKCALGIAPARRFCSSILLLHFLISPGPIDPRTISIVLVYICWSDVCIPKFSTLGCI
jgi:hypothetical protein